ncbi:MAG TPA: SIS domain-containing protein [Acidimicrobiales bacterium]|nr:SIS domain-containing protein [Acidimicrobiales bacterium]
MSVQEERTPQERSLGAHLAAAQDGLASLALELGRLGRWGADLRRRLERGHRVLAAGNGGSAALAHHLAAEMVGRFDRDRPPFSALALSGEPAGVTAIGNDYGYEAVFARQVEAHGRPGDVLVALSTSGRSANLLAAAAAARRAGVTTWALTGPAPNPLAAAADDVVAVPCPGAPSVQDVHQVAVHLLCLAFENAADPW